MNVPSVLKRTTNTPKVIGEDGSCGAAVCPMADGRMAPEARTHRRHEHNRQSRDHAVHTKKGSGVTPFSLFSKIQAHQRVLVAKVDEAVGDGRKGANGPAQNLRLGKGPERFRRCGGEDELAGFPRDQQPIAGERHRAGAIPVDAPFHRARLQLHRAKARVELLAAVKAIQVAVGVDARRVVIRQHIV